MFTLSESTSSSESYEASTSYEETRVYIIRVHLAGLALHPGVLLDAHW